MAGYQAAPKRIINKEVSNCAARALGLLNAFRTQKVI
jgi:hypothetical protein